MAAPSCTVCASLHLAEINRALLDGASNTALARRFGLGDDAVRRHRLGKHYPVADAAAVRALKAQAATEQGNDLLSYADQVREKATDLMRRAEATGNIAAALSACREVLRAVDAMARISGTVSTAPMTNIAIDARHVTVVQTAVLSALAPFPEARLAVAQALEAIEAEGG